MPDGYTLATWEGVDHEEMRAAHNRAFVGHYGFTPVGTRTCGGSGSPGAAATAPS